MQRITTPLPPPYWLSADDEFVTVAPGERPPPLYYVGEELRELPEEDTATGEPIYFFNIAANAVYKAKVINPTNIEWIPAPEIPRFVINLKEGEPATLYGKLVNNVNISAAPARVSLKDVLRMADESVK